MHPSFDLGFISFPAYFTLLMVGYLLAVYLAWRHARSLGIDPNRILDLAIFMLLAGLLGARIMHVLADGYFWDYVHLCTDPFQVAGKLLPGAKQCTTDAQCVAADVGELCNLGAGTCHPGQDCLRAFKIWYGGLAYYGGLLLAIPIGIYLLRRWRIPVWKVGDLAGFAIPLGLVFGRIGCTLAGCCFGKVCADDSLLCLIFPKGSPAWDHQVKSGLIQASADHPLSVVATQPLSSLGNLLIFAICYYLFRKHRTFDGKIFWTMVILYSVFRFGIEFFRDDDRGVFFGNVLSSSQLIAIPLIAVAVFMLWLLKRRARAEGSNAP